LKGKCPSCNGAEFKRYFNHNIDDWSEIDCKDCCGAGWLDGTYFDILDLEHGEQDEE
jgi:hypothetical protein